MTKYESLKSTPGSVFFYSALILLGVYSFLVVHYLVTLFIILVASLGIFFHYSAQFLANKERVGWLVLREVVESIIEDKEEIANESLTDSSQVDTQTIVQLDIPKLNKEFVDKLRSIGIDGVLILLFLLLQKPTLNSVKNINESVQIPIATLYRDMNQLLRQNMIYEQYVVDQPQTAYYQITEKGDKLIEELRQVLIQYQYLK
jgi:DNA-binding HxlR family transcriptional regulator